MNPCACVVIHKTPYPQTPQQHINWICCLVSLFIPPFISGKSVCWSFIIMAFAIWLFLWGPDGTTWGHLPVSGGSQRLLMPGAVLIFKTTICFLGLFVTEQKYQSLYVFFPSHINVKVHFNDISAVDFNNDLKCLGFPLKRCFSFKCISCIIWAVCAHIMCLKSVAGPLFVSVVADWARCRFWSWLWARMVWWKIQEEEEAVGNTSKGVTLSCDVPWVWIHITCLIWERQKPQHLKTLLGRWKLRIDSCLMERFPDFSFSRYHSCLSFGNCWEMGAQKWIWILCGERRLESTKCWQENTLV